MEAGPLCTAGEAVGLPAVRRECEIRSADERRPRPAAVEALASAARSEELADAVRELQLGEGRAVGKTKGLAVRPHPLAFPIPFIVSNNYFFNILFGKWDLI